MRKTGYFQSNVKIDDELIKKAYEAQRGHQWTFFDERLHLENLFSQRVNFILFLFPVMITAYCAVDSGQRMTISLAGLITLLVFYIPLIRTYFKLDIIQKICYRIPMDGTLENNPSQITHNYFITLPKYKKILDKSSPALFMLGIAIMILFMLLLFILSAF